MGVLRTLVSTPVESDCGSVLKVCTLLQINKYCRCVHDYPSKTNSACEERS